MGHCYESECVSYDQTNEISRLRQAYADLPKTEMHGVSAEERHPDIRPEWIMQIIAQPYERFEEYRDRRLMTVLVGRVPPARQWIKVVFMGVPETGLFHTVYMGPQIVETIRKKAMAEPVKTRQSALEPEPVVKYFPETQSLWIDSGNTLGEGETIAEGVVVFYGKDDDTTAEGVRIEFAEQVLKPFVDAILAKYGAKPQQPQDAVTKQT